MGSRLGESQGDVIEMEGPRGGSFRYPKRQPGIRWGRWEATHRGGDAPPTVRSLRPGPTAASATASKLQGVS